MGISVGIVIRAAGLAAIAGTTLSAHAQLREWAAPVSANWNVAANWLAPNIPDSAAESAALKHTIESFPDGLDTLVGERGVTLSGGQKQRATLARGLIRHSPVLLLDDCFSSVDTETEEHILAALRRLRAGQTTLLVSHRVSTARHADRIVVLDNGRITEIGSHVELLSAGGWYAELERIQREGADAEDFAGMATA